MDVDFVGSDERSVDSEEDEILERIQVQMERDSSQHSIASASQGADDDGDQRTSDKFTSILFGMQPKTIFEHRPKGTDIMGLTYNGRQREFIILDSKGITTWKNDGISPTASRNVTYPKYEYCLITNIIFAQKLNVYFALGKDFSLRILNKDFEETYHITSDMRSVLFMLFNPVKDELITGGIGGVRIWRYHQVACKTWNEIKPMANYQLDLKYELNNAEGQWVKRVDIDVNQEHIYCCSDTDLYAYDMDGNSLFTFKEAHSMAITGCAYSAYSKFLLTASVDTEIKAWSISGGLVHTFRGHSRAVTNLMIHPEAPSLFISSSLDGSVRFWSMDTMDCIYNLVVSSNGVLWMGLSESKQLYLGTMRGITLWSLNTICHFWAPARNRVTDLSLVQGEGKSTRVLAVGEDGSVRIFSRHSRKNLSTVLPPPSLSPLQTIVSVAYNRVVSVAYLLVNPREIWVYTTRTDPACRIAVWNILDIQQWFLKDELPGGEGGDAAEGASAKLLVQAEDVHRALEDPLGNESICACHCVCYLNSEAMMWTNEGFACPIRHTYLLFGMEDGRILFMDPVVRGKKYFDLRANKDPVIDIKHDKVNDSLLAHCKLGECVVIQVWSLPKLELQHEIACPLDVKSFLRLGSIIVTAHQSGHVRVHPLTSANSDPVSTKHRLAMATNLRDSPKADHPSPILGIECCPNLEIYVTCSAEGLIKIWEPDKILLTEITLDDGLSSVTFLNSNGDLLVGYKNHIFIIEHSKVCPSKDVNEESDERFEVESDIYEDPSVLFEGVTPPANPINLQSYLVPFEIEFSKDFLEGRNTIMPQIETAEEIDDQESGSEDGQSAAPTELYMSPMDTPRRSLSMIDMTLDRNTTHYELSLHMKAMLEGTGMYAPPSKPARKAVKMQKEKNGKDEAAKDSDGEEEFQEDPSLKMEFELPNFGISPGPTPSPSIPSTICTLSDLCVSEGGESSEEEDELNKKGDFTKTKTDTPEVGTKVVKPAKMEAEFPPRNTRHNLANFRLDRDELIERTKARIIVEKQQAAELKHEKDQMELKRQELLAKETSTKKPKKTRKDSQREASRLQEQLEAHAKKRLTGKRKKKKRDETERQELLEMNAATEESKLPSDQKQPDKSNLPIYGVTDVELPPKTSLTSGNKGGKMKGRDGATLAPTNLNDPIGTLTPNQTDPQSTLLPVDPPRSRLSSFSSNCKSVPVTKLYGEFYQKHSTETSSRENRRTDAQNRNDYFPRPPTDHLYPEFPKMAASASEIYLDRSYDPKVMGRSQQEEDDDDVDDDYHDKDADDDGATVPIARRKSILKCRTPNSQTDAASRTTTPSRVSFLDDTNSRTPLSGDGDDDPYFGDDSLLHELDPSLGVGLHGSHSLFSSHSYLDREYSPYTAYSDYGSEWTFPREEKKIIEPTNDAICMNTLKKGSVFSQVNQPPYVDTQAGLKAWRALCGTALSHDQKELAAQFQLLMQRYSRRNSSPDPLYRKDCTEFGENYYTKTIERHLLLRMQRQLRTQSAIEKRENLAQRQQEKRRTLTGHHKCGMALREPTEYAWQSENGPRSNTALVPNELMRSMSGTSYRLSRGQSLHKSRPNTALTTTTQDSFWTKRCETETPFRLSARVTPKKSPGPSDYGSMRTSSVSRGPSAMRSRSSHSRMKSAKSFMHDPPPSVKTMDSAGPHRPRVPSKSIPSKCSRYVLIQSAQKDQSEIAATPLEEQLIAERFPQWKEKWLAPKSPQSCIPPQPILEHPQFQQIPVNSNIPE